MSILFVAILTILNISQIKSINPLFKQWNCVGIIDNINFCKPYSFQIGHLPLVLWKHNDILTAKLNICPHMASSLSNADITNAGCLKCKYHGMEFETDKSFGKVIEFQGKLFWSFDPIKSFPTSIPYFDDPTYCGHYLQIDMPCSLVDSALNTMDIRHPQYVHSMGFGNDKHPYDIIETKNDETKEVSVSFNYHSNELIRSINGGVKHTQNKHIYVFPSTTYSVVSFANNNLVIGVNLLPLENKKTRWFVSILHNYNTDKIGIKFINILAKTILLQDFTQLQNQFMDCELKKEVIFGESFDNEMSVKWLNEWFHKEYKLPSMEDCVELYREYKKKI